jgi:hypothetical protein
MHPITAPTRRGHCPLHVSIGRRGSERKLATPARVFVWLCAKYVEDSADQNRAQPTPAPSSLLQTQITPSRYGL